MDKISIEYIWFSEDHITIPKDIKKELDLLAKKEICNTITTTPEQKKGILLTMIGNTEYHGEWYISTNPLDDEEEDAGYKGCKID